MSGSLPQSPALASVRIKHNTPNIIAFSVSGRRQVKSSAAQYFSFDCGYSPMKREQAAPIIAFLTRQKGMFESFTAQLPQYSNSLSGYSAANPLVVSDQTAGDSSITFDGAAGDTTMLKAGDFVKFSGHNKVYMVIADVITSPTGTGSINITPVLQQTVINDETITVNNVPFTVFLEDETQEYRLGLADMVQIDFKLRETL